MNQLFHFCVLIWRIRKYQFEKIYPLSLPSTQETRVQWLVWEDPGRMKWQPRYSGLENSMDRGAWQATWGCRVGLNWATNTTYVHIFITALFIRYENNLNVHQWMRSKDEINTHTHNGIQLSLKKQKILPFTKTWMNLEGIRLYEISQTKTDILLFY